MGHSSSRRKSQNVENNLEQFLQHIFTTQCTCLSREEIETGVEEIINKILRHYFEHHEIKSTSRKIKILKEYELLKVGSFYEKTKNHFPNEFDFMVVFGEADSKPSPQDFPQLPLLAPHVAKYKASFEHVPFRSKRTSSVIVDRSKVLLRNKNSENIISESAILKVQNINENGPAQTIQFYYTSSSDTSCLINVDLVFALRSSNINDHLKRSQVQPPNFYEHVLKNGKVHYVAKPVVSPVKILLTLTETEVHFMRGELSKGHVKVYRLLKYLINGNDYNDDYHGLSRHSLDFKITSYQIKCAVIHHHYSCEERSQRLSKCVLDILYVFSEMLSPVEQPDFQTTFMKCILQNEEQNISLYSNTILYGSFDQRKVIWDAFKVFVERLEKMSEYQLFKPFRESLKIQKRVHERHKRHAMDVTKTLYLTDLQSKQ